LLADPFDNQETNLNWKTDRDFLPLKKTRELEHKLFLETLSESIESVAVDVDQFINLLRTHYSIHGARMFDSTQNGGLEILRDVFNDKFIEEELAYANEQLQKYVDGDNDILLLLNKMVSIYAKQKAVNDDFLLDLLASN
jgi:hypothetical protein